ncbi:MAG: hypothetical protein D6689_04520 [Deltaproteobacteria bacterium]|nr:MAG: hypothetical protein D6689_04520 [Deltaproteobacteria bacterium]
MTAKLALALAALAHLAARIWLVAQGRWFASEDDPYRAYVAYLLSRDGSRFVGEMWLPGHPGLLAVAQALGISARAAGPVVSAIATVGLAVATGGLARELSRRPLGGGARPDDDSSPWLAAALVLASPLTLVLGHSHLAEVPAAALSVAAVWGLFRWLRTGRAAALAAGSAALAAAAWMRYEAWGAVVLFPAVALWLGRRRRGAWLAFAPAAAPLAWMALQWTAYGDPLLFWHRAAALAQSASPVDVLGARARALVAWAPAVAVLAAYGAWRLRGAGRTLRAHAIVVALLSAGVWPAVVLGQRHLVFPDRLSHPIEVALIPLAAVGLAGVLARSRVAFAAAAAATIAAVALGPARPAAMWDPDSVQVGRRLAAGELEPLLAGGALLVERPRRRPPFGWASVGVLWGRWDRIVWATPEPRGWELVEPTDVVRGRRTVATGDLAAALRERGVRAAWTVTPAARRALAAAWPGARALPIGRGALVVRPSGAPAPP